MVMRYHWGLGIGHMYSHDHNMASQKFPVSQVLATTINNQEDISNNSKSSETSRQAQADVEAGHALAPATSASINACENTNKNIPEISTLNKEAEQNAVDNNDIEMEDSESEDQDNMDVDSTESWDEDTNSSNSDEHNSDESAEESDN